MCKYNKFFVTVDGLILIWVELFVIELYIFLPLQIFSLFKLSWIYPLHPLEMQPKPKLPKSSLAYSLTSHSHRTRIL